MVSKKDPLRYRISDWRQLKNCLSNNSKDLSISVTTFLQDDRLNGLRIQVIHEDFGVLFACVIDAKGRIVTDINDEEQPEFTVAQILTELKKYGFLIEYHPTEHLPGNQLSFLINVSNLGFDKLRIMNVWRWENGVKVFNQNIVVFNSKEHPDWLNAGYSASQTEFKDALMNSSAVNITLVSEVNNYNWSWLYNFVASISDILEDNTGIRTDY